MTIRQRLTGTQRTIALALYERGMRLQRELEETQAALDEQATAAALAHGLDPSQNHHFESNSDGEVYLVEVQHDDGV